MSKETNPNKEPTVGQMLKEINDIDNELPQIMDDIDECVSLLKKRINGKGEIQRKKSRHR